MDTVVSIEEQLRAENADLRSRLEDAEETLRAIRSGEVDAIVVESAAGPQMFILQGVDAESNRLRGEILALVSEAVIAIDSNHRVTYLNAAAERQYGVTASEALGRSLSQIYEYRWLRPEDEAAATTALRETGHWRGENIHIKRNGETVHVESSVSSLAAGDGAPPGMLAVIRDIAERRKARQLVRESEQRLRAIYDGTREYLGLLTPDGTLLEANRASLAFANSRREDVVGKPYWDTVWFQFTPGAPEMIREAVARAAEGQYILFEARIATPAQEIKTFDISLVPIRDAQGKVVLIVPEGRDVTERRKGENALRESEERLRKIFEHAATGIAITNLQGQFEQCNPSYCALLGYTEEELRGMTFSQLLHPDDCQKNLEEIQRLHEEDRPYFEIENRYLRRDGASVWVHKFVSLLRGESGLPEHLVALVTDVTERRRAEAALQVAKEAAEAANRAKDRFLAVLSHELRTPLTPVLMAVGALEHDPGLPADVREDLTMIKRNIELETKLIDDLLDLTRITSGKLELNVESVDLNETVRRVCAICRSQLRDRNVHLEIELAEDADALIVADSARLQQVLWNVLKNAIKFASQEGNVSVKTSRLPGGRWEIRVKDDGIGISVEVLPRIFDAFEQGGERITRQFGGLGLGLAICKALVELHHGSIRAESPGAGQGSTFIIELPGRPPAITAPAGDSAAPERGQAPPLRLLMVEDHADTARTLSRLLREAGFAVTMASNVSSAIAAGTGKTFDVLVSDIGLPDGKGDEVMRWFRIKYGAPGIAMSGYGMEEDSSRSREAGFTEHLVKPIDFAQLVEAIHRVTDDRA